MTILISFPMKDHHDPICIGLYHGLTHFFRIPGWLPWDGYHGPWHLNFPGGYRHLRFQVVGGRPRHFGKGCLRNTGAQKKKKRCWRRCCPSCGFPNNGEYPLINVYITIWKDPSKSSFSMGKSTINSHVQ